MGETGQANLDMPPRISMAKESRIYCCVRWFWFDERMVWYVLGRRILWMFCHVAVGIRWTTSHGFDVVVWFQRMAAAASVKLPTRASPPSALMGMVGKEALRSISMLSSSGVPQSTRATAAMSSWVESLESRAL